MTIHHEIPRDFLIQSRRVDTHESETCNLPELNRNLFK